jgi:hypothetical protein
MYYFGYGMERPRKYQTSRRKLDIYTEDLSNTSSNAAHLSLTFGT